MTDVLDNPSYHLANDSDRTKRILALDGGGARGLLTLGILKRIEETLEKRFGSTKDGFRLSKYFDLIAGTSTGSIIAVGLALGKTVTEIEKLYTDLCPKLFKRKYLGVLKPKYRYQPLEEQLRLELSIVPKRDHLDLLPNERQQPAPIDLCIGASQLRTGLMICMSRIDKGIPWIVTNHAGQAGWFENQRYRPICEHELWKLVRASSAAPTYFDPVELEIAKFGNKSDQDDTGIFVDGAMAGLNNPCLEAFLAATRRPFNWNVGHDKIFLISVGTGWWKLEHGVSEFKKLSAARQAMEAAAAMIQHSSVQAISTLQSLSVPHREWCIENESGISEAQTISGVQLLTFSRYDAEIDEGLLRRIFKKEKVNSKLLYSLRDLANRDPGVLQKLFEIGCDVGNVTRRDLQGNPVNGINQRDFPNHFNPLELKVVNGFDEFSVSMKPSSISVGNLPPIAPAAPSVSESRYSGQTRRSLWNKITRKL